MSCRVFFAQTTQFLNFFQFPLGRLGLSRPMGLFVQLCACLRCSDFRILRFLRGGLRPPKFTPLTNFLAQAREDLRSFVDFI
jgi:hypothetical protein